MPETPPGKRFQIHLSTAITMMIWAGFIMCFNLVPTKGYESRRSEENRLTIFRVVEEYGWPAPAITYQQFSCKDFSDHTLFGEEWQRNFSFNMAMFDLFWAAFQIYGVWLIGEWLARDRETRKELS